jgi:hypothetical protein
MFVSDTNLTADNIFWPEVLKSFPGGSLLINEASTISPPRYNSEGKETNGVANSYDHFVLDKNVFSNCNNGEVYNYYKSDIESDIQRIYGVRLGGNPALLKFKNFILPLDEGGLGGDVPPDDTPLPTKMDYPLSASAQMKINAMVSNFSNQLSAKLTVKNNEVVADDFQVTERIDGYKRRVFMNQLTNAFYYRFYQEILSDHFPVSITCKM